MEIFTLTFKARLRFARAKIVYKNFKSLCFNQRVWNKQQIVRLACFLFLLAVSSLQNSASAQNIYGIKGVVSDSLDAYPLSGVNITGSDKKVIAITDAQGQFSFRAASNTQITFSLIGYKQIKLTITKDEAKLNLKLATSSTALKEVTITTALGIRREERALGYAATVVKGEDLTQALSSNWTDALSGKVAGLNLIRSNSGPVGSNKIILRGENNLTGNNEALIVLDGVVKYT